MKHPSGENMGVQGKEFEGTESDRQYFYGERTGSEIKPFHFDQDQLKSSIVGSGIESSLV